MFKKCPFVIESFDIVGSFDYDYTYDANYFIYIKIKCKQLTLNISKINNMTPIHILPYVKKSNINNSVYNTFTSMATTKYYH